MVGGSWQWQREPVRMLRAVHWVRDGMPNGLLSISNLETASFKLR